MHRGERMALTACQVIPAHSQPPVGPDWVTQGNCRHFMNVRCARLMRTFGLLRRCARTRRSGLSPTIRASRSCPVPGRRTRRWHWPRSTGPIPVIRSPSRQCARRRSGVVGHSRGSAREGHPGQSDGAARNRAMPATMAATNTTTCQGPKAIAVRAGPGHSPTRPQPMPNRAAPPIRRRSRSRRDGISSRVASTGMPRRLAMTVPRADTATAPPMTKARLGSQSPKISRKPSTLAGLTICETISPKPKSRPEPKAVRMAGTAYAPMT